MDVLYSCPFYTNAHEFKALVRKSKDPVLYQGECATLRPLDFIFIASKTVLFSLKPSGSRKMFRRRCGRWDKIHIR